MIRFHWREWRKRKKSRRNEEVFYGCNERGFVRDCLKASRLCSWKRGVRPPQNQTLPPLEEIHHGYGLRRFSSPRHTAHNHGSPSYVAHRLSIGWFGATSTFLVWLQLDENIETIWKALSFYDKTLPLNTAVNYRIFSFLLYTDRFCVRFYCSK